MELSAMSAWLQAHQDWLALMIGVIAFLESVAIIGLLLPGVVMLFTAASLAGGGALDIWVMLLAGFAGAVLGDGVSFVLGQVFHDRIRHWWPFRRHPEWLQAGETFFHRHGGISIALGRFIGPVRPVIPLVAGMLGMPSRYFYFINIISAAAWAPAYLLPGYLVGASVNWRHHAPMELLALVAALLVAALILGFALHYFSLRYGSSRLQRACSRRQLLWAAWGLGAGALAVLGLLVATPDLVQLNHSLHHWLQPLRTPVLDKVFTVVTSLADRGVIVSVLVLMGWWLLRDQGIRRLLQFALFVLGLGLVFQLMSHGFAISRPPGSGLDSYAFPSGHTTYGVFVALWLGHYLCRLIPGSWRPWLWSAAFGVGGLIALSRLYLGKHWLSDVTGGALLATIAMLSWLLVVEYFRSPGKAQENPQHSRLFWWRAGQLLLVYLGAGLFLAYL